MPAESSQDSAFVTGGAGFIGSHLVDALLARGVRVTVYDNFSTGSPDFLAHHEDNPDLRVVNGDVLDREELEKAMNGHDVVWHVAADPDVRGSGVDTGKHLTQNVTATHQVLEAMRSLGITRLGFTSTSTVYGEARVIPTPENYGPLEPISVYGASKLASEALISSFCGTFDVQALTFRFANVVGPRSNHGVTYDFVKKLRADPKQLEILGDGRQLKSYCHVEDCVEAMLFAFERQEKRYECYNIGSEDAITVTEIADIVGEALGLRGVNYSYTGGVDGGAGWKGDVKLMQLAIDGLMARGWKPKHSSAEAIRLTAEWLVKNA